MKNPTLRASALAAVAATLATLAGAAEANITFEFGTLQSCSGGDASCVLSGASGHTFSSGGTSVTATGYEGNSAAPGTVKYITLKTVSGNGMDESGLGESNTYPGTSDSDYEIAPGNWVVLDNSAAYNAGYKLVSVTLGSVQGGGSTPNEGAKVYAGTTFAGLSYFKTVLGTDASISDSQEVVSFGSTSGKFVGVQDIVPSGSNANPESNVTVVEEIFAPVPEPESMAMVLAGIGCLTVVGARRMRNV